MIQKYQITSLSNAPFRSSVPDIERKLYRPVLKNIFTQIMPTNGWMYACLLYDYNNLYLVLLEYDDTELFSMAGSQ